MKSAAIAAGIVLLFADASEGRDILLGRDVKTIREAIKLAEPGDTIHLEPIVYRDYAGFCGKKGEAGRPITLDGHGEISPGLFANDHLLPRLDDAIIDRWFFLMNRELDRLLRDQSKSKP